MHELPVTQAILKQSLEEAAAKNAKKITDIYLELGEFTGYVDESIDFYWKIVAGDTIASDAVIHITRTKGQLSCLSCQKIISTDTKPDTCPFCHSFKLVISGGDQLLIKSINVEE